ncbi:MAG: CoA pyrophosphatase [Novosphingobium sp.]
MNNVAHSFSDSPPMPTETAQFLDRARLHLRPSIGVDAPQAAPSDYDLNPEMTPAASDTLRPAAVLIPIIARDQLTVLLTRRTETLSRHPGQIAFPGGRIDATDATPAAAALREAQEEVGLDPALVTPLGFLDTYRTGTGYRIEPLVALVAPQLVLTLQESEVAEAFEVPLHFLMDPANHETHAKFWQGAERRFYAIPYGSYYIWGATAGILKNMHQRLFAP